MNCIIIEDEIPAQRIIKNYCAKIDNLIVKGVFNSALKANSILITDKIDLIFLDINLPDISGLDFLKSLQNPPAVIMTTAYQNYAAESFELDTIIDYLVKPFSFDRFLKAINKVNRLLHQNSTHHTPDLPDSFFLTIDKSHHKVYFEDLKYIISERNYCTLITKKAKYTYIESLRNLESKLPLHLFIRVHRSYIINTKLVDKISGNTILIGDDKIPIGRTYKTMLFNHLKLI
ncbi:response regulator [Flavobacteriaceae bacterium R38]|nr:response regulator [Flavobacteriaceae bacterium R38]